MKVEKVFLIRNEKFKKSNHIDDRLNMYGGNNREVESCPRKPIQASYKAFFKYAFSEVQEK